MLKVTLPIAQRIHKGRLGAHLKPPCSKMLLSLFVLSPAIYHIRILHLIKLAKNIHSITQEEKQSSHLLIMPLVPS